MTFKRGDALARQGEVATRCFYVRSGYGKVLSHSPGGHEIIVGFIGPRDVAGHAAASEWGTHYLATTIATGPMDTISWTRASALQLAREHPLVHDRLDGIIARNLGFVLNRLHTISEGRLEQRLARVLVEIARRHGQPDADGIMILPTVTREDFAALTGVSFYTTSRLLADWEAAGLLTSRRGHVRLIDLPRLRALARARS